MQRIHPVLPLVSPPADAYTRKRLFPCTSARASLLLPYLRVASVPLFIQCEAPFGAICKKLTDKHLVFGTASS